MNLDPFPKVTIGIPTYNNSKTIEETIRSLQNQSFQNWECYIVDDESSDNTAYIASSAIEGDPRFSLIANSVRLGAAGNWNKTLSFAKFEYFKLLCGDDVLSPDCLQSQVKLLDENSDFVICSGSRNIINETGKTILKNPAKLIGLKILGKEEVIDKFISSGSNFLGEPSFALFRTYALKKVGGFDRNWSYLIDMASYISTLDHGKLILTGNNMGSFRISSSSWSSKLLRSQKDETIKFLDYIKSFSDSEVNFVNYQICKIKIRMRSAVRYLFFKFLAK